MFCQLYELPKYAAFYYGCELFLILEKIEILGTYECIKAGSNEAVHLHRGCYVYGVPLNEEITNEA